MSTCRRSDATEAGPPSLAPVADGDGPRPLVSVVMPTYNRCGFLAESIGCVLDQTARDVELIVSDDCSTDDTRAVVEGFAARDRRVRYRRNNENLNMPGNLNAAIRDSRGEYVVVAHDHDLYDRGWIEKMLAVAQAHPDVLFVHTGLRMIDQEGGPTGVVCVHEDVDVVTPGRRWLARMLKRFSCPVCANALVRRDAHERYGLYDPRYGFISDVEMWMRLCVHGDVGFVAEPLIELRTRESDHFARGAHWAIVEAIHRIHRRYAPGTWGSRLRLAWRIERHLARLWLGCWRSKDRRGLAEARAYLRSLRRDGWFARGLAMTAGML